MTVMLRLAFGAMGHLFAQAVLAVELADPFKESNKYLICHQLDPFVNAADRQLHLNLDGEPVVARRFEFKTHPRALSVVLGRSAAKSGQAIP